MRSWVLVPQKYFALRICNVARPSLKWFSLLLCVLWNAQYPIQIVFRSIYSGGMYMCLREGADFLFISLSLKGLYPKKESYDILFCFLPFMFLFDHGLWLEIFLLSWRSLYYFTTVWRWRGLLSCPKSGFAEATGPLSVYTCVVYFFLFPFFSYFVF